MADANEQDILDDALQAFTHEAMKEVVAKYAGMDIPDIEKKVELEVGMIISPWIPEKFTEVDVKAIMGRKYSSVIAEYMTNNKTMMIVVYDSPLSVSYKVRADDVTFEPDGRIRINSLPTQIREMIEAPVKLGISSRGCSSTPEVAKTNNLGIVDNPNIDWSEMSSVNMDSALTSFDTKGTSGWTEECTITSSHADSDLVWYNPYGNDMSNLEEINFTIEELDELVDLLNDVESKVMEF